MWRGSSAGAPRSMPSSHVACARCCATPASRRSSRPGAACAISSFAARSGAGIRLRVLDIAREDLRTELNAELAFEATVLHRLVYEEERGTRGGEPFRLLLADFEFETTDDDTRLLGHLARIAAAAQVPLVTAAGRSIWEPALRGEPAGGAAWQALRVSDDARWVALGCPRVLARLPYGRASGALRPLRVRGRSDGRYAGALRLEQSGLSGCAGYSRMRRCDRLRQGRGSLRLASRACPSTRTC